MKVRAYGKLNLTLAVTGKVGGLHTLDSVMTTVSVCDEVSVEESDEISVTCAGIPSERNTARRAAEAIAEEFGMRLRITIEKGIPVGGGMGGSSADVAAVLVAAERLLSARGKPADLRALSARLGSDVAFMVRGGMCRVRGTGDEIAPLARFPELTALVIECGSVDTAACYAAYDRIGVSDGRSSDEAIACLTAGKIPTEGMLFNDLLPAARSLNGRIAEAERLLAEAGVRAHLTGSGGCLFALTADARAAEMLEKNGFASRFVRTLAHGVEIV